MKTRWRLFPYLPTDYRAAEQWLNAQAAQGLALEGFFLWFAHLAPTEQTDLKYCIELTRRQTAQDEGYRALCLDAGWEEAEGQSLFRRPWRIFRSLPGRDPVPLQTDPQLELSHLLRHRLLWEDLPLLLLLPLLLALRWFILSAPGGPPTPAGSLLRLLSSWSGLWSLLCAPLLLASLLCLVGGELHFWLRARPSVRQGQGFPVPGQRGARLRGWLSQGASVACLLVLLLSPLGAPQGQRWPPHQWPDLRALPVVMSQDLGWDDSNVGDCHLTRSATPFFRFYALLDPNRGGLRTQTYAAATPALAQLATLALMEEAEGRGVALIPVSLGFDQSWGAQLQDPDGPYGYLLLRQGNTAVLLSGPVDFTAPAPLAMLQARLTPFF